MKRIRVGDIVKITQECIDKWENHSNKWSEYRYLITEVRDSGTHQVLCIEPPTSISRDVGEINFEDHEIELCTDEKYQILLRMLFKYKYAWK